MSKNIILLTDYGTGDPAFTEVLLQLKTLLPESTVIPQSVPAFSTLATGFWIYQFAMTENLGNFCIYSNTAPRLEEREAQKNNKGERLVYAKLKNGFEIVGVNAKYCFSFIKPQIEKLHFAKVENEGSQFRSRDKYPQIVKKMIEKDLSFLGDEVNKDIIPEYPRNSIAFIDGYGNIKTTTRLSEVSFTPGQKLAITLNNMTHVAYFSDGTFNIPNGQIAFAQGSTGHNDKFMEVFYRGGNAANLFGNAHAEQEFTIKAL